MKLEVKNNCPLDKFKPCRQFDCGWFIQVRGTHPQTGEEEDMWSCAMSLLPLLLIENAKETRQGAAATESFRNEMVKDNAEVKHLMKLDLDMKAREQDQKAREQDFRNAMRLTQIGTPMKIIDGN